MSMASRSLSVPAVPIELEAAVDGFPACAGVLPS